MKSSSETLRNVLYIIGLLTTWTGFSSPLVLKNSTETHLDRSNFDYYYDTTEEKTIDKICQMDEREFTWNPKNFEPKKYRVLWLKKEVVVLDNIENDWILNVFNARANSIQVYLKSSEGSPVFIDVSGADIPYLSRKVYDRFPAYRLQLQKGTHTLYIRYESDFFFDVTSSLQPIVHHINSSKNRYFFFGGFYFVLLLLVIYNGLFYFSTRDKIYLYYMAFIVVIALDRINSSQLGFEFLWPNIPVLNHLIGDYKRIVLMLTFTLYTTYFLEMREEYPKLYRMAWSMFLGLLISRFVIAHFDFIPAWIRLLIATILTFSLLITIFIAVIKRLRKGHKPTQVFAIGYISIMISFMSEYAYYNQWIPFEVSAYFSMIYSVLIEVLMFSFALSIRIKKERLERERALESENSTKKELINQLENNEKLLNKVNFELEDKVKERTIQLQAANEQLSKQAALIHELNSNLDKQNWQLKKEIKAEQTNRILGKDKGINEFFEVFPNKTSCYQFLSELKWKDGYVCKKCGHTKDGKGPDFLSKRCAKCSTNESVTAHTLFHKLKFPIQKAFYITYVVFNEGESLNLSDISREIDLNYKSCQRLRDQVRNRIDAKMNQGKKLKSWDEILLDE